MIIVIVVAAELALSLLFSSQLVSMWPLTLLYSSLRLSWLGPIRVPVPVPVRVR